MRITARTQSTTVAAFLMCAASLHATVIEYDAESGVTPTNFGFLSVGAVSGTFASSGGVPGLGDFVWETTVHDNSGGYIFDLAGIVSLNDSFKLTAYIRGLDVQPQGGAVGVIERNRPSGSAASAIGPSLEAGQWYFVEVLWFSQSATFRIRRWRVDADTGELLLVVDQFAPINNSGSPGSEITPNSFAFYCANDGSDFLRTQFDNIRLEIIPPQPPCGDANQDGIVSFADITFVLANWGNVNACE